MIIKIKTIFMDKQVINITESDLHNIVKESVNKVLTELDCRTYANAAKKGSPRYGTLWYGQTTHDSHQQ